MSKPLLIEIGVEELPAIPFLKELPFIEKKWQAVLEKYHLTSPFRFYYTPRRLVFIHESFLERQPDSKESFYGAPVEIAFKEGKATPAALGFAKKCGVSIDEIGRGEKNGKEVLFFEKEIPGVEAKALLPSMVEEFLESLHFGKSMRWGSGKKSFIRPLRWFVCMLDGENLACEVFDLRSRNETYLHRTFGYESVAFDSIESYLKLLEEGGVILDADLRREKILENFLLLEKEHGITIERDQELLDEVVAITEYPNALMGHFDAHFLKLPKEVIVTSMKEHQRYFPVFKEETLANNFIVVSNAVTDNFSKIIQGNEKVLHARLSDALFFYENDLKRGLDNQGLKNITFMEGLGSIYDKSQREAKIASYLHQKYALSQPLALLERSVMLSKADLLTDMVYEFTELQGLMGYYYAKAAKEEEDLALALKEQYLPTGEESTLPTSDFSSVVAMANKLDTLFSLFKVGKIPTGTKDPFGLRRAVVGIVRIVEARDFDFDIKEDLHNLCKNYEGIDLKKLENFFIERLLHYYDANASVIQAVLQTGERNINKISQKVQALKGVVESKNFKEIASTFKRVANIVKDLDMTKETRVDPSLFEKEAEQELYTRFLEVQAREFTNYETKLKALFGLKDAIDHFFDTVMVNVEDEAIKRNRKYLIASIYKAFREIAEIKEVTV